MWELANLKLQQSQPPLDFKLAHVRLNSIVMYANTYRSSTNCATGEQWYSCAVNNFQGCCSVDACSNTGCPDVKSISTSSVIIKSTTLTTKSIASSAIPSTTTPPTTSQSLSPANTSELSVSEAISIGAGFMLVGIAGGALIVYWIWKVKRNTALKIPVVERSLGVTSNASAVIAELETHELNSDLRIPI
ncbi:hypothetical protein BX600DRAFT_525755 [Xylariales sp. PMI_506]|nr:hypothetical protein BX600DRAFT_525755 [Xylariales sp. PMI_506]